jgi:hypothetical protein
VLRVKTPLGDIVFGRNSYGLYFLLAQRSNGPGRYAQDQGTLGEGLAFRNQRPGGDQALRTDRRPVQDGRPHPDQAIVADAAAVKNGMVANGAACANFCGAPDLRMDHRAILNIASLSDLNRIVVATQYGSEPYANVSRNPYVANYVGRIRDPAFADRDVGPPIGKRVDRHLDRFPLSLRPIAARLGDEVPGAVLNLIPRAGLALTKPSLWLE